MKAIGEIGWKKSLLFSAYSVFDIFYKLSTFPQIRALLLELIGAHIGSETNLMNVRFFNWHHTGPGGLKIGDECFIGDETLIDLYDKVTLEDQVTIAQRVTILTHLNVGYKNHPLQKYFPKVSKGVTIRNGSVIGALSTILPGVTIGSESFVGAGSVVTKDVPPKTLVAGNPARIVKKLQ